ncbi:MAG TPA: transporter [Verrucomicrobiota bacterium]|nr:transporter [Verrucomicrobiota bacterium]
MKQHSAKLIYATVVVLAFGTGVRAGEIGHFNGGFLNIRDFFVPAEPGFYGALYNYYYTTDRLNDQNGNEINDITIIPPGGGPGTTLNLDVNVDLYVVSPTVIWVPDWKPLGARCGILVAPTFASASLEAALSRANNAGLGASGSSWGVGDLLVQPVWLDWSSEHWDLNLSYGFYTPLGRYGTDTVTVSGIGPVKVESADNIGYGFWTQQFQGAVAWYPMENKATAVTSALTYEINSEKEDFDLTPGNALTLSWGISQYLPLKKDHSLLLEIGVAGYDSWQTTEDSGSDANSIKDQVHAVGGQLGVTYVPWNLVLNFHAFYEYAARDRFQGQSYGLSIAKKF